MQRIWFILSLILCWASPSVAGIADGYVRDAGISGHPDVIFADDFEDSIASIQSRYNGWQGNAAETVVSADVASVSGGEQSVLFQPADSSIAATFYRQLPTDYDQLFVRYYVKYSGTNYHHTGVYVGGYSDVGSFPQGDAGIKGIRENNERLLIASLETAPAPGTGTRLDTYMNWVDMQGTDVGGQWFGRQYLQSYAIPIQAGTWQCVELMVKLNTTASGHEGELRLWIDGLEVVHFQPGSPTGSHDGSSGNWTTGGGSPFSGFQWRDVLTYGLNWIKLQNYDTDGTPTTVRFDDLVVATSYIGPISLTGPGSPGRFSPALNLRRASLDAQHDEVVR